nr:hypothetical protein [Rhizobium leguminosarum]
MHGRPRVPVVESFAGDADLAVDGRGAFGCNIPDEFAIERLKNL